MSRITAREEFPQKPSESLALITGEEPMVLSEARKRVWNYIKRNNLQDPSDRRIIKTDEKLSAIFKQPEVSVLRLAHLLKPHLKLPTIGAFGNDYNH